MPDIIFPKSYPVPVNLTWIHQSMTCGGHLSARQMHTGKIRAEMEWIAGPRQQRVVSDPCPTLAEALDNLNTALMALMEDCAAEMRAKGAA